MSEKSLMIVNAVLNTDQQEAFRYYSENAAPLFKAAGATPVAKYKVTKTMVGTKRLQIVAIMEFPNEQAITHVFESEAYKALLPYRDKAFMDLAVFIGNP
ncbi:DUF1330 domain-containing protein [Spongiimicrobium salis]|uniref:DUF1330 domain-containing protein n=1 Tax=Spongiimicrobium salis TaxID=1667022 RepID=UPI00374D10FD